MLPERGLTYGQAIRLIDEVTSCFPDELVEKVKMDNGGYAVIIHFRYGGIVAFPHRADWDMWVRRTLRIEHAERLLDQVESSNAVE